PDRSVRHGPARGGHTMSLSIDATDITVFADSLAETDGVLHREILFANQSIISHGVSLAQDNAPRQDGILAGSIQPIGAVTVDGGSFGTSLIYANQREYGGTIYGKPYLHFRLPNGQWVKTRSVTQTGSFYMKRAFDDLQLYAMSAWGRAIE